MKSTSLFFRMRILFSAPEDYVIPGGEKEIGRINKIRVHYVYRTAYLKRRIRNRKESKKGMIVITDKRLLILLDHFYYMFTDSQGNTRQRRKRLKKGTYWELDMNMKSWFNTYISNSLVYSDEFAPFVEMEIKKRVIPVVDKVSKAKNRIEGRKILHNEVPISSAGILSKGVRVKDLVPSEWATIKGYRIVKKKVVGKNALFIYYEQEYSVSFYKALVDKFEEREGYLSRLFSRKDDFSSESIFPKTQFIGYDILMDDEDIDRVVEILKNAGIKEMTDEREIGETVSEDN